MNKSPFKIEISGWVEHDDEKGHKAELNKVVKATKAFAGTLKDQDVVTVTVSGNALDGGLEVIKEPK